MEGFQQRVVDEKAALDDKIEKLSKFSEGDIFDGLPEAEQVRLEHQIEFMGLYSDVLGERIAAFSADGPCQACDGDGCKHCSAVGTGL